MRKPKGALFISLLSVAAVLAACNGANNGLPGPGPSSGPTGNCGGPPSSNQLLVLYPIPNSKNAPKALGNIYISTKGQLPPSNEFDFLLSQSDGASTFTGPFTGINESQIPKPHATPKYSNPVYYESAIAGPSGTGYIIGPNQYVSLFWNDGGRNCVPHFLVSSFRTTK
ncbi:MAG TPA: hypothetical protein VKR56_03055 [Candidatus Cybelea sp.]|nr:hypothetical protein [Candidatus Cybelea sp.]